MTKDEAYAADQARIEREKEKQMDKLNPSEEVVRLREVIARCGTDETALRYYGGLLKLALANTQSHQGEDPRYAGPLCDGRL